MILQGDWHKLYKNKEALDADLHGFEYKGPGWYEKAVDTLFIVEHDDGKLWVICWNWTGVRSEIKQLLNAEVHWG